MPAGMRDAWKIRWRFIATQWWRRRKCLHHRRPRSPGRPRPGWEAPPLNAPVPKARHVKARHGSAGGLEETSAESRRDDTLPERVFRIKCHPRLPQHCLKFDFVGPPPMVLNLAINVICHRRLVRTAYAERSVSFLPREL